MYTFYIVDDDRSIINILSDIIRNNNLGEIIGVSVNGQDSIDDIRAMKPDIILLDYLLDDLDGLDIINKIDGLYDYNVIMISEVSSKEMIAKAYRLGIEFFINKPINVIEVMSVIRKVQENIHLRSVVHKFEDAYSSLKSTYKTKDASIEPSDTKEIKKILGQLGIIGETGSDELIQAILWVKRNEKTSYKLSDVYKAVTGDYDNKTQRHAVEKRIRRAILKSFNEIASRGIIDYNDFVFETYSTLLFDFSEIHKQMKYVSGKHKTQGKINVRKFIEGVVINITK